jgi:hypothetical protein
MQLGPYQAGKIHLEDLKELPDGSEEKKEKWKLAFEKFTDAAAQLPDGILRAQCFHSSAQCATALQQSAISQKHMERAIKSLERAYDPNLHKPHNPATDGYQKDNWFENVKMFSTVMVIGVPTVVAMAALTSVDFFMISPAKKVMKRIKNEEAQEEDILGLTHFISDRISELGSKERLNIVVYAAALKGQTPEQWLESLTIHSINPASAYQISQDIGLLAAMKDSDKKLKKAE